MTISILRIIDANSNRASEALRTIEEYARFVLNDAYLSNSAKQMRHQLTAALQATAMIDRVTARDSQHDVGCDLATQQEYQRESAISVVAAACGRLQQALRCLEEYSKLILPASAPGFEQLRYDAYQLHKTLVIVDDSNEKLKNASICAILDGQGSEAEFTCRIMALDQAGVDVIQLRDKQLDDAMLLQRAKRLRTVLSDGTGHPLLIINDRPDLALLSGADGVHLGQTELSVLQARLLVGTDAVIGVSTHSIEQVHQALCDGANYIGCGPVFPSRTKQFESFPGTEFLQQVSRESAIPAFAIGGIALENVELVAAAGFTRIAVGSCLIQADSVKEMVQALRQSLFEPQPEQVEP